MLPLAFCLFLAGCDPVTRHQALTTVFEGVPSFPPTEELCSAYYDQRVAEEKSGAKAKGAEGKAAEAATSAHLPYEEKKCNDCHTQEKDQSGGFVRPLQELCFVCHKDFIKGAFVHGPVAVGECVACHLPHTSNFSALLKADKSVLCGNCHREKRIANDMHERVVARQMACIECHDPHFGKDHYFLK